METKENMALYESLRSVPKEAQKQFDNGRFKGTDINPMWRIKKLTEVFGPCGIGWYVEVVNRDIKQSADPNVICTFVGINLYVKYNGEWSKPIYGEGGNTMCSWNKKWQCIDTSDEAFKMAYTDALSNAAKQLGLGADVWFEADKVHSTKYDLQTERKKENEQAATPESILKACKSKTELRKALVNNNWMKDTKLVELAKSLATNLPEEAA